MSPYQHQSDFISETEAKTLPGLFKCRADKTPDSIAYQQYEAIDNSWHTYSWAEIHHLVARWHMALAQLGLQKGDRVAIILKNSIEWTCFDQAAQSLGLIVVSLYPTDTAEDIAYILAHAGARLLILRDEQQWLLLASHCDTIASLQSIWCLTSDPATPSRTDDRLRYLSELLPAEAGTYQNIDLSPDDVATIIYTSGTTGRPKGVMLTHHNILANAEAVQKLVPAYPDDIFLSFLPLAHGFERTVEYYFPMMAGCQVCYARSIKSLAEDLITIKPTIFISAPRLYEKIYAAINSKIADHFIKRKLFDWTLKLGWQQFEASQDRAPPLNFIKQQLSQLLHHLVAQKVLARLGGHIRVAVTGAAPLSLKVSQFFLSLGLPLLEGYGLTEAGPVVSGNCQDNNLPGSVGEPLADVEVALSEDNELLVRSPSVMKGYWQQEGATQEEIDPQGWLHTGDIAEIKDNKIFIRGRLKDILVTSTGEKVAPADIEAVTTLDPLFEQAMVIGEGKPYLTALLVLNPEAWSKLATTLGLDADNNQSLYDSSATAFILDKLALLLDAFPGYAQIHAVHLSLEPWTIENGLLTPTLKIKRQVIESRFSSEIRSLYKGHALVE